MVAIFKVNQTIICQKVVTVLHKYNTAERNPRSEDYHIQYVQSGNQITGLAL